LLLGTVSSVQATLLQGGIKEKVAAAGPGALQGQSRL